MEKRLHSPTLGFYNIYHPLQSIFIFIWGESMVKYIH
jgi:hypothetical protein